MRLGLFATWPRQINPNRRKAWNVSGRFSCFVTRSLILLYHPILRILWPHSKARVQPFIGIGAVPSVITGNPDPAMISTSHVERNNRTINYRGTIIISRVRQSLPIQDRTAIWFGAIERFIAQRPAGKLFDLLETGEIVAWDIRHTE